MAVQISEEGDRIYFVGYTFLLRGQLQAVGAQWDKESRRWWVESRRRVLAESLIHRWAAESTPVPYSPDPYAIELSGKGEYRGRSYFLGRSAEESPRVRLLTLPDRNGDFLDFWVDRSDVRPTKTYHPRTVGYGPQERTEYLTLGSIADFIESKKRSQSHQDSSCPCCGASVPLILDPIDGAHKCLSCCRIPK